MDSEQLVKLLGASGFGGALLFILYRVLSVVGERIVQAMDRLEARLDDHTARDLASHEASAKRVTDEVAELRSDVGDVRRELQGYAGEIRGVLASWEPTPPPREMPAIVTPRGTPVVASGEIQAARVVKRIPPHRFPSRDEGDDDGR